MKKRYLDKNRVRNFSFYLSEDNFEKEMETVVEPFLKSHEERGTFEAVDGSRIAYYKYVLPDAKAGIVISHGFSEFAAKYGEWIYLFLRAGYSVFFLEHRGHGESARAVEDKERIHVVSYEEYVQDVHTFVTKTVFPANDRKPCFLYAHSMGGAIGALVIEEFPTLFDGAVLSAPMFSINIGPLPVWLAKLVARIEIKRNRGKEFAIGQHGYDGNEKFEESCSLSEARFRYIARKRDENVNCHTSGGTYSWALASLLAQKRAVSSENAAKIVIPVLLFQAGNDTMVRPKGQEKFVKQCKTAEMVIVTDSKHEIYNSDEIIQQAFFEEIMDFFEKLIVK